MTEIIEDVKGLLKEAGKTVYIFRAENIMAASPRKDDINKYLREENAWVVIKDMLDDDYSLIYGLVIDPKAIPFELSQDFLKCWVWVMQDKDISNKYNRFFPPVEIEKFTTIADAVEYIEDCFEREDAENISEFAIIVGHELDLMIQVAPHIYGALDAKKLEEYNVQN